jgi:hypothetical protein
MIAITEKCRGHSRRKESMKYLRKGRSEERKEEKWAVRCSKLPRSSNREAHHMAVNITGNR